MKRKTLICALGVVLVLALVSGLFVACNPKEDPDENHNTDPQFPSKYTISYSLGTYSGTGEAPAKIQIDEGSVIYLAEVGVAWEGHIFLGWQAEGGELLQPGAAFMVLSDMTFVAQWKDDPSFDGTAKVTFLDPTGAKIGEPLAVGQIAADPAVAYFGEHPLAVGTVYDGWFKVENGVLTDRIDDIIAYRGESVTVRMKLTTYAPATSLSGYNGTWSDIDALDEITLTIESLDNITLSVKGEYLAVKGVFVAPDGGYYLATETAKHSSDVVYHRFELRESKIAFEFISASGEKAVSYELTYIENGDFGAPVKLSKDYIFEWRLKTETAVYTLNLKNISYEIKTEEQTSTYFGDAYANGDNGYIIALEKSDGSLIYVFEVALIDGELSVKDRESGETIGNFYKVEYVTVFYDAGGAPVKAPTKSTLEKGGDLILPSELVWEGHYFLGWQANGQLYAAESRVTVSSDMEFAAQWLDLNDSNAKAQFDASYYGVWNYEFKNIVSATTHTFTVSKDGVKYTILTRNDPKSGLDNSLDTYAGQAYSLDDGYLVVLTRVLAADDDGTITTMTYRVRHGEDGMLMLDDLGFKSVDDEAFEGLWVVKDPPADLGDGQDLFMFRFDSASDKVTFAGDEFAYVFTDGGIWFDNSSADSYGKGYGEWYFTIGEDGAMKGVNRYKTSLESSSYDGELTLFFSEASDSELSGAYISTDADGDRYGIVFADGGQVETFYDETSEQFGSFVFYGYAAYDPAAFGGEGGYRLIIRYGASLIDSKIYEALVILDERGNMLATLETDGDIVTESAVYVPVELDGGGFPEARASYTVNGGMSGVIYEYDVRGGDNAYVICVDRLSFVLTVADGVWGEEEFTVSFDGKERVVKASDGAVTVAGAERGTYTGSGDTVRLDGFGNATVDGEAATYTFDEESGTLAIGEQIYYLDLDDRTYTRPAADALMGKRYKSRDIAGMEGRYYILALDGYGIFSYELYEDGEAQAEYSGKSTYRYDDEAKTVQFVMGSKWLPEASDIAGEYKLALSGDALVKEYREWRDIIDNFDNALLTEDFKAPPLSEAVSEFIGYWQAADGRWVYFYIENDALYFDSGSMTGYEKVFPNVIGNMVVVSEFLDTGSGLHLFSTSDGALKEVVDGDFGEAFSYSYVSPSRPVVEFDDSLVGTWVSGGMEITIFKDGLFVDNGKVMGLTRDEHENGAQYTFAYDHVNYRLEPGIARYEYYLYIDEQKHILFKSVSDAINENWQGDYCGEIIIEDTPVEIEVVIDGHGLRLNGAFADRIIHMERTQHMPLYGRTFTREAYGFHVAGLAGGVEDEEFLLIHDAETGIDDRAFTLQFIPSNEEISVKKLLLPIEEPQGFDLDGVWYSDESAEFIKFTVSGEGKTEKIVANTSETEFVIWPLDIPRMAKSGRYGMTFDGVEYAITVLESGELHITGEGPFAGTYAKGVKPEQAQIPEILVKFGPFVTEPVNEVEGIAFGEVAFEANKVSFALTGAPLTSYSIVGEPSNDTYYVVMIDMSKWKLFKSKGDADWTLHCMAGYSSEYNCYLREIFDDVVIEGNWKCETRKANGELGETTIAIAADGTTAVKRADRDAEGGFEHYSTIAKNTIRFIDDNGVEWIAVVNEDGTLNVTCDYFNYGGRYDGIYQPYTPSKSEFSTSDAAGTYSTDSDNSYLELCEDGKMTYYDDAGTPYESEFTVVCDGDLIYIDIDLAGAICGRHLYDPVEHTITINGIVYMLDEYA